VAIAQLIDRREGDRAVADHLLGAFGQLEQLHTGTDAGLGPTKRLRGAGLGQAAVEHRPHRPGLLVRVQLLARDVLNRPVGLLCVHVADHHRHLGQLQRASGREPMEAGHKLEGLAVGSDDERDEHALQRDRPGQRPRDRPGQRPHVRLVERAHVVGDANAIERDPLPGFLHGAHGGSSSGLGL
jgi:hypothetical protein